MKNKSINGIQYLRGYAAVLVVFNHLWAAGDTTIEKTLRFNQIGGFGVDIFFVITGFIMAYTMSDFGRSERKIIAFDFIKRRIERIYPLHIFLLIPALIVYLHRCQISHQQPSIPSIIGSILLLPDITSSAQYKMINHVEWSLVYEMYFYITLSFFMLFSKNKIKCLIHYSLFLIISVIAIQLFGFQGDKLRWVNLSYIIGDELTFNFILGFLIFFIKDKVNFNLKTVPCFILALSLTYFACYLYNNGINSFISYSIPSFLIVLLFTANKKINNTSIRFLLSLGSASYAIYLTHPLLETAHYSLEPKLSSVLSPNLFHVSISLVAITLGMIIHICIEKRLNKSIHKLKNN